MNTLGRDAGPAAHRRMPEMASPRAARTLCRSSRVPSDHSVAIKTLALRPSIDPDRRSRAGDERADWFERDPLLGNIRQEPRFRQIVDGIRYRLERRHREAR